MPDSIKIHLYQVLSEANTPDLAVVLSGINKAPLANRLRTIGKNEFRLESIVPPGQNKNLTPYWLLDFTRLRFEHGPGKVSRTSPVQGFALNEDEGFGEETAALYDPTTGYMLIQYNHFGIRAPAIRDYLSLYNTQDFLSYDFRVKLHESAEAQLANKPIITKVHVKLAPMSMTAAQRRANVSLGRALELSDSLEGQTMEMVISAGRKSNSMLESEKIQKFLSVINSIIASDRDAVEKFEVTAKGNQDERAEAIDMLYPKLEQEVDGIVIGADRRYTQESRWGALLRARSGWNGVLR